MSDQLRTKPIKNTIQKPMADDINALHSAIKELSNHRYVRVHNSIPKMMGYQLLRGPAFGLGSFLGATIVVSSLVYLLSFVDFLPIVGDWAKQISAIIRN